MFFKTKQYKKRQKTTNKITYSCGEATGKVHLEVALEIEKNGDEDDEL